MKTTIGVFSPFIYGKGLPKKQRQSSGAIPVYGSNGVVGTHDKALVDGPVTIIGRKGTIGAVHYCKGPCWAIDTTFYVEPSEGRDPRFTYYLLSTLGLENMNSDSAVPGLNRDVAHSLQVIIPQLEEQQKIGMILGSFDDKIEANRHMNDILHHIIVTLFESWFVNFEFPNEQGEPYKSNRGEMEHSEFGMIPKGWTVGCLGDIADNYTKAIRPGEVSPHTPYIGLEHMPRNSIALSEWGRASDVISNKFLFHRGEILFGKLRPYFHKVGISAVDGVCSTDILVIIPKTQLWYGVLLCYASSADIIRYAHATSSGTKMPRTNWDDLSKYKIVLPPQEIAKRFTDLIRPFTEMIMHYILEFRILSCIRNLLLPKLLSRKSERDSLDHGRD